MRPIVHSKDLPLSPINREDSPIVDEHAYATYKALEKHGLLTQDRIFVSSKGVDIDCASSFFHVKRKSILCEPYERPIVLARARLIRILYGHIVSNKRRAYGTLNGGVISWSDSILDPRRSELLEMFGRFFSDKEVHAIVRNDWHLDVTMGTLREFRKRNLDRIKELQEEHKRDFSELRLVHKKSRLEEYTWMYMIAKQKYIKTENREDRKAMMDLLYHIKREVEGDILNVQGELSVNIEQTINVHIRQEINKRLTLLELVISRVAIQQRRNPLLILYRLQNSFYSKFNGVGVVNDIEELEEAPPYPSDVVYDLDKLQMLNQLYEDEEKVRTSQFDDRVTPRNEENLSIGDRLKQELLEIVKKKGATLSDSHQSDRFREKPNIDDETLDD